MNPPRTKPGETTLSRKKRERPRVPLVLKLFLLTALLIVVVVGLAVGITIRRSNAIASKTVHDAIASAGKLFKDLEQKRLRELSLGAFTVSRDVNFFTYIENALSSDTAGAVDTASILDQLEERRAIVGSDVMMLADDQGLLVTRTDRPVAVGSRPEDLYESQPLVKEVIDSGTPDPQAAVMNIGNTLYHAAVAPLRVGADRPTIGYLINAYAIDDRFANQIAESTNIGVLFLAAPRSGAETPASVRSIDAPGAAALWNMAELDRLFQSGTMLPPSTARIDQSSYLMTAEPLSSRGAPVGAGVFVRSLERELAPFREIETTLLFAGAAALLLAFILSWFIAKRLTGPIEKLASVAQSVTEGDYSVRPEVKRSDEIGILARSFEKMISALRDKAELEQLYQEMSARVKEREVAAAAPKTLPATRSEGTVMVTDLRGTPTSVADGEARDVISLVAGAMKLQESEIKRQEGRPLELVGHRLVSVFDGDRGVLHAIRAARAINEELALKMGDQYPMTVGVGIATGEFVSGSVELGEDTGIALVGNAPLLALLFAWEAPSGFAFVSLESAQAAGNEVMAAAQREEVRLRWLPNPLPVASLPLRGLSTGMMQTMGAVPETLRITGSTMPAGAPRELAPGSLFANRYQIEQVLGRGGMGIVYKAIDKQLEETVAIKTLPGDAMTRSPEEVERFKREIRLARKITHRNVLRTYDYGEADGMYFISMECVRGYTLAELLQTQPQLPMRVALGIARQTCRGLQAAHEEGIIHRDIKPQNVLMDSRGEVKLMDFGIARMTEAAEALTSAGLIVGTPHYMSPEQVQARPLDARSDVYSMGVLLYEMVCGKRPFDSPTLTSVLTAHITQPPRPPIEIRREIGPEVNRIVLRCLAKEPAGRYANAGELLQDLDRLQVTAAAA